MGLVGNGNFNNHWSTERANKCLEEEGFTMSQIEKLKPKERIQLCTTYYQHEREELINKMNI